MLLQDLWEGGAKKTLPEVYPTGSLDTPTQETVL